VRAAHSALGNLPSSFSVDNAFDGDDGSAAGGAVGVNFPVTGVDNREVQGEDEFGTWGDTDSQEGGAASEAIEGSSIAAGSGSQGIEGGGGGVDTSAAAAAAAADGSSGSDTSAAFPHPYLSAVIDSPDVAELLGAANMRELLLQEQQDLQQQQLQPDFLLHLKQQLQALPSAQKLPYDMLLNVLLLLDLTACSDDVVLMYWRALSAAGQAAAAAEAGSSSSEADGNWEEQCLHMLLLQHAGYDAAAATQLHEVCVELRDMLQNIEVCYAAASGKTAYVAEYAVMKPDPAGSSSSSSTAVIADGEVWLLTGIELLPSGLQFAITYKPLDDESDSSSRSSSSVDDAAMLATICARATVAGGAAATHHLAVLLVRASLQVAWLPWHEYGTSAAAADAASNTPLQSRLAMQKSQLRKLLPRLRQLSHLMGQHAVQQRHSNRQQTHRCQRRMLCLLLLGAIPAASAAEVESCAEQIHAHVVRQLALLSAVQDVLPMATSSSSSSSSSVPAVPWAPHAAALHSLFEGGLESKLQQWQEQLAAPLAARMAACAHFEAFRHITNLLGSSSSSSSSVDEGSRAAAALQQLSQRAPFRWPRLTLPGSLQQLLAAVETSLCQQWGQLLADSTALLESCEQLAGKVAAGAAACDSILQAADQSGVQLGQLLSDNGEAIAELLQRSEGVATVREQHGVASRRLLLQLTSCLSLSVQAEVLWHMVATQWLQEARYVGLLKDFYAVQQGQQHVQLLEQLLDFPEPAALQQTRAQLRALEREMLDTLNSIGSILAWQQQQRNELQLMQHTFRSFSDLLIRVIDQVPQALQGVCAMQQHAHERAGARADRWREKFKVRNVSRTFRPSFSDSSSSSSQDSLNLSMLTAVGLLRANSLHLESLEMQRKLLLRIARSVATAGLGMLWGMGLQLPGAVALAPTDGSAAACGEATDTEAGSADAASAANAEDAADAAPAANAEAESEGEAQHLRRASIIRLRGLLVWQASKLEVDDLKQLSMLLRCIGGDADSAAGSRMHSRQGLRSRAGAHAGSSSGAAPTSSAAVVSNARDRLAHALLAESKAKQAIEAAAVADPSSSSSSSRQCAAQQVLWQLLLAVRPAAGAALHCLQPLPDRCVNYGAFARAALDWKMEFGGHLGFKISKQQDGITSSSSGSSSHRCRHCKKPGYIYAASVSAVSSLTDAAVSDSAAPKIPKSSSSTGSSSSSSMRAVCGAPSCVADELRELAQQGPPTSLMHPDDWQVLGHSTAEDVAVTGGQDISR
jgi:hypothetical protein